LLAAFGVGPTAPSGSTPQQRNDLIEFVTGNMLFALLHEIGHMHIQEMGLPVLGRGRGRFIRHQRIA
jgi:hypothetical protein